MPLNNENFIIRISSQIAAVDTNIVYEFLLECLRGYSEYSVRVKHMSLLYMEPWINCLNSVEPRSEAKIVEVLDSLVKILTIRENEDFTFLVQAKFWRLIGAHKQFVDILLPKIVNAAKANTLDSKQNDMLISVVIAMIPEGQVVPALFNLGLQIYSDALKAENVSKLVESSHWKSISIINRILANVSFDFHIPWETYFGQLLYFVMISIGCGSHVERRAIQVILHNAFHQLYSKFESPAIVRGIVYLVDPKNLNLFGQSGAISTSDQFSLESFPLKQFDTDPVYDGMNSSDLSTSDLSNFTELVLDIIKNGHDDPKVLEMWKSSFAQLFSSNAFSSYNLAPDRLFLPLSYCLEKLDAEIFKKFSQVIVQEFSTDLKTKAVASVLHCLNFLFKKGLEDEELVGPLFWMCLGLMQFGHLPVFRHCLNLFHQILVKMSPFNFKTVSEYSSKLEPASSALDAESKLSPKKSFNLYLSAILLRGLSDLSTSNTTRECLNLLLSLSVDCKLDTSESISYIVLLAPTETLPKLFASAGLIKDNVDEEDQILLIDKLIEILQKQSQPVMVAQISMLTLMLDHWKTEDDLLVLCRIFARLAEIFPTVLNTIATKLSPRLLKLSSDSKLQSISAYIEIVSKQLEKTSKNTSIADFDTILANAGMEGLFAEASFDRLGTEALKTRAKLVAGFVNAIKSLQ